jgi:hypothetical protein
MEQLTSKIICSEEDSVTFDALVKLPTTFKHLSQIPSLVSQILALKLCAQCFATRLSEQQSKR